MTWRVSDPTDIILLAHNRPDYLAAMIDALEARTRWPHQITVVDNASGPATRGWLRANEHRLARVVWNARNEHLAGHQRGISATSSALLVISDADLIVSEPDDRGCWLTRLHALADRHPDFALIGARLNSVSAARNEQLEAAPLIDGEILETSTGVWLNLIRRSALRVPYMSDGITCYALRRSGHRVGIAADVWCTHLGDEDPVRHPAYLARKQSAGGWSTTYPDYPEASNLARPPTALELALAAPVFEVLAGNGIERGECSDLSAATPPPLAAADSRVAIGGAARAVAQHAGSEPEIERAFTLAGEWLIALTALALPPRAPAGWSLVDERCGPHPIVFRFARLASRARWRRALGHTTSEHREDWLRLFAAGCFGEDPALRVYVYRNARPRLMERGTAPTPSSRRAPRLRRHRTAQLVTKARRVVRAEWHLRRGR